MSYMYSEPESTTTTTDDMTAMTHADIDDAIAAQAQAEEEQSEQITPSQKRISSIKKHKLQAQGGNATVQTRPIQGPPREADVS